MHLQGGEQRSPAPFERQSAFEREQTPPVQGSRESRKKTMYTNYTATISINYTTGLAEQETWVLVLYLEEHKMSIGVHWQRQAKGFLNKPSAKSARELFRLSRNEQRIMTRLLTGHCHLKGIYLNWGWWTFLGAMDANRHLKGPDMLLVIWDTDGIKIYVPRPWVLENRWLCRHLCHQDTAICSKCRAARCLRHGLDKRPDMV